MKIISNFVLICMTVCVACVQTKNNKIDAGDAALESNLSKTLETSVISVDSSVNLNKSCPEDMVEVDGNFCPNVEQTCIKVDKNIYNVNGYVKCDEFAPTKCLSKEKIHMHFCIDKYEWPNKKGEKPKVMITWNNMKNECNSLGKRLCKDHEWTLSCEGPHIYPYPYGLKRDSTACNIDKPQRIGFNANQNMTPEIVEHLWQGISSGEMDKCVSYYGVHDMTGNIDEATVNSTGRPYQNSLKGGAWLYGHRNRCRPATIIHDEDFAYYEAGGRCCKDIK